MSACASRLRRAVKAAVSALRASLAARSADFPAAPLLEGLEERLLFTTYTGTYWVYNPFSVTGYCGPFYYVTHNPPAACVPITAQTDPNASLPGIAGVEINNVSDLKNVYPGRQLRLGPVTASDAPVTYQSGQPIVFTTDLTSDGYGKEWGQTRSWNVAVGEGPLGPGWDITDWPHLVDAQQSNQTNPDGPANATDSIVSVQSGSEQQWFDSFDSNSPHTYAERVGGQDRLVNDGTHFTLYDSTGGKTVFSELTNGVALFQSYTDPAGNTITATYVSGELDTVTRSNGSQFEKWTYGWVYVSDAAGNTWNHLSSVTLSRSNDGGGSYHTVRSVAYAFYDGTTAGGDAGYLKSATIEDAGSSTIDVWPTAITKQVSPAASRAT